MKIAIAHTFRLSDTSANYHLILQRISRVCLVNFLVLSIAGLWLRGYTFLPVNFFAYKNLLHAHSHFAFGGWVMPGLLWLTLKYFPELQQENNYRHWRNVFALVMISAYGMLFSFPFQGYFSVSITFSTLSILGGIYAGILVWRSASVNFRTSTKWLRAAFFYFVLSAIGPFATGPLIAMGKAGTEIYYNAIYFYLHFQYNGFFAFIILAVIYRMIERTKSFNNGKIVFRLMNAACIPAFALSLLWSQPGWIFNVVGGLAAALQLIAAWFLFKDLKQINWKNDLVVWMFRISVFAFLLKCMLQLASAFPIIAELAYTHRNFVIAYLHLVLLGFVSVFILSSISKDLSLNTSSLFRPGMILFITGFIITELLLVLQAAGWLQWFSGGLYVKMLFTWSLLFPIGLLILFVPGLRVLMGRMAKS